MQDLFEYAVIRVVPKVEREEFLNVGVIVYCGPQKFLDVLYELPPARLLALDAHIDLEELSVALKSFKTIGDGSSKGGTIASLTMAERFRWLTSSRSTIVQVSKVHPGLTGNAQQTLNRLFDQLVKC